MPKVNIYIRNEDLEQWLALKDRPQFIHDALNGNYTEVQQDKPEPAKAYYEQEGI